MPGTFSLPPRVHNPDMHHGSCVTHVPWYMPGLLTSGFLRSQWKRSRNSRRMHNPQYYVSGKRPVASHRRPEQGLHENNLKCGYGSGIKQVSGVGIHNNRAFIDKFLKFCMHVGMGQRFSKLIASKLGSLSGGRYMQNPRWPPPRIVTDVSNWNLQPYTFVIPFFLGFQVWQIHFKAYLRYSWSFKRSRAHFLIIYYEKRKQVAIHHFLMHTNHHWIMLKFIPNHRATWCYIVVTL